MGGQELQALKGNKGQDDPAVWKFHVGVRLSFPSGPQRRRFRQQIHPGWELGPWFGSRKDGCGPDL